MYVSVYDFMCVCACVCVLVRVYIYITTYMCVYVSVRAYIYLNIHIYMRTQTVYINVFTCTFITSRSPDAEIENFDTSLFFGFIVWCGCMMYVVQMYVVRERQGGAEKKNLLV